MYTVSALLCGKYLCCKLELYTSQCFVALITNQWTLGVGSQIYFIWLPVGFLFAYLFGFPFRFVFNGFEYGAHTFILPEWVPQAFKFVATDFLP